MVKFKFLVKFQNKYSDKNDNKKLYVAFFFLLVNFQSKHCLNKNIVNSCKWALSWDKLATLKFISN